MSDEKNSKVCVDDRDQELDGNISSSLSAQLSVLPIKEKVASIGRVGKRKPGSFKPGLCCTNLVHRLLVMRFVSEQT